MDERYLYECESDLGHRFIQFISAIAASIFYVSGASVAHAQNNNLFLSYSVLSPISTPECDGYLDRVVVEMFRRNNLVLEKEYVAPARALDMATRGLTDGDMSRSESVTTSHPDLLQLPESTYSITLAGMYIDPEITLASWSDFNSYNVGYIRGWQEALRILDDHQSVTEVSDPETLLQMLKTGRIDVAMFTILPAKIMAKSLDIEHYYFSDIRQERKMYMYLNKRHENLIEPLNESLREMKRDGTYHEIMGPYIKDNK